MSCQVCACVVSSAYLCRVKCILVSCQVCACVVSSAYLCRVKYVLVLCQVRTCVVSSVCLLFGFIPNDRHPLAARLLNNK